MKCQLAALREFGVPDDHDALVSVDVVAVEANQLSDPGPFGLAADGFSRDGVGGPGGRWVASGSRRVIASSA